MVSTPAAVKDIFLGALDKATPQERAAYLEAACESDAALRREVEVLLAAHDQPDSRLDQPAHIVKPPLDATSLPDNSTRIGTMVGPYKLHEQIGEGGMGLVYMAEQQRPMRRLVAVKVVKPGMDSRQVIIRFEAERQALAMMDHPNIARVFEAGTTEAGRPYFVMELVRGIPINEFCDQKRLTVRERLALFVQVCQAVQHAHQKGIIHRDLKPTNVLVTLHDTVAVPKVIDFGIAKALGPSLTDHTLLTGFAQMIGTPLYMSPEQAEMNQFGVDTRSDVYSLGVMLYELLTGNTPFDKETLTKAGLDEMRRIIREQEPPRPSARLSTLQAQALSTVSDRRSTEPRQMSSMLRGELDWIVMKALEKDRNRRYESATAFAADILRYLSDEPVQACPPSLTYRLSKVLRRYKVAAAVIAVVTLTVCGSAAFSAVKYRDESRARRRADEQTTIATRHAQAAETHAVEVSHQKTEAVRQRGEAFRQKAEAERQRDAARQNLYYADMRLAHADIDAGNSGRSLESVLGHLPARGEADSRGWEWYYLLGRSHEAEQSLYGHRAEISKVAWSPDGRNIASASHDRSACVWDAKTGKLVRRFEDGPSLKRDIDWSPDGKKLAWVSTTSESMLRIWDRETDEIAALPGHAGSIWGVAWSHDGKLLATCSIHEAEQPKESGNVKIWDVEKLEPVAQMTAPPDGGSLVWSVSWSPDDKLLAIAAQKPDTHIIWEVATQQQLSDEVMGHACCAFWHPTKQLLAVGDAGGNCLLWDHDSRKAISRWKAHQGMVRDLHWAPDGNRLLSAGGDGLVKVWDAASGRQLRSVAAHTGSANSVAWSPTGKKFASAGTDGVIRVWSNTVQPSPAVIDTKINQIMDLAWDSNSKCVFLACGWKIAAFDATSKKQLSEVEVKQNDTRRLVSFQQVIDRAPAPGIGIIVSTAPLAGVLEKVVPPNVLNNGWFGNDGVLSPDKARIVYVTGTGSDHQYPTVFDHRTKRVVQCTDVVGPAGIAWSPDGTRFAVAGRGEQSDPGWEEHAGWVHVFDANSGKRVRKLQVGTERVPASAVAWSHDGRRIAAATEQGLCEVWMVESGRKLVSGRIHTSRVRDLAWSSDDLRIASGGNGQQVHLWDSSTGQQLLALESHGASISHICWSPDGRKLAAVSDNGIIKVWDATAGFELPQRSFWTHLVRPQTEKEYQRLIAEQHWSEAADVVEQMIGSGSNDFQPLYRLALLKLQVDDQAAYRATCIRMLSAFGQTDGALDAYFTARVCALRPGALQDYSIAIALARQAVKLQKSRFGYGNSQYPDGLGAILFRAGNYEEALQYFQEANNVARTSQRSSASVRSYLFAMTHYRLGHAADAHMWLGRANTEADKELAGETNPPTWESRLTLELFKTEATELCRNLAAEISHNADHKSRLAELLKLQDRYFSQGIQSDLEKGIVTHTERIEKEPAVAIHYSRRAILQGRLGRFAEAITDYERAIERNTKDGMSLNNLAWILAVCPDESLRDPQRAVQLGKTAATLNPASATFANTLGVAQYRAGQFEAAIESLQLSVRKQGPNPSAFDTVFLAMAHWQLGQPQEAKEYYEQAVQWMKDKAPNDAELIRFSAEAEQLLGQPDEAKQAIQPTTGEQPKR